MTQQSDFTMHIEYCKSCPTHSWCTHHDEQKYQAIYLKLKKFIHAQFPNLRIDGNRVPDELVAVKPNENKYFNTRTNKYVTFPIIGAFQITLNNQKLFSKKLNNCWPNFNEINDQVYFIINGKARKQIQEPQADVDRDITTAKDNISANHSFLDSTDKRTTFHKQKNNKNFTLTDHFKTYKLQNKDKNNQLLTDNEKSQNMTNMNSLKNQLQFAQFKRNFEEYGIKNNVPQFLKKKAYFRDQYGKKQMIVKLDSIQQESILFQQAKQAKRNSFKNKNKKKSQNPYNDLDSELDQLQSKFKHFQQRVQHIRKKNRQFDDVPKIGQNIMKQYKSLQKQKQKYRNNKLSQSKFQKDANQDEEDYLSNPIVFAKKRLNNIDEYINGTEQEKNQKLKKIYGQWKLLKKPYKSKQLRYVSPYRMQTNNVKNNKNSNHEAHNSQSDSEQNQTQQHINNHNSQNNSKNNNHKFRLQKLPPVNPKTSKQVKQNHFLSNREKLNLKNQTKTQEDFFTSNNHGINNHNNNHNNNQQSSQLNSNDEAQNKFSRNYFRNSKAKMNTLQTKGQQNQLSSKQISDKENESSLTKNGFFQSQQSFMNKNKNSENGIPQLKRGRQLSKQKHSNIKSMDKKIYNTQESSFHKINGNKTSCHQQKSSIQKKLPNNFLQSKASSKHEVNGRMSKVNKQKRDQLNKKQLRNSRQQQDQCHNEENKGQSDSDNNYAIQVKNKMLNGRQQSLNTQKTKKLNKESIQTNKNTKTKRKQNKKINSSQVDALKKQKQTVNRNNSLSSEQDQCQLKNSSNQRISKNNQRSAKKSQNNSKTKPAKNSNRLKNNQQNSNGKSVAQSSQYMNQQQIEQDQVLQKTAQQSKLKVSKNQAQKRIVKRLNQKKGDDKNRKAQNISESEQEPVDQIKQLKNKSSFEPNLKENKSNISTKSKKTFNKKGKHQETNLITQQSKDFQSNQPEINMKAKQKPSKQNRSHKASKGQRQKGQKQINQQSQEKSQVQQQYQQTEQRKKKNQKILTKNKNNNNKSKNVKSASKQKSKNKVYQGNQFEQSEEFYNNQTINQKQSNHEEPKYSQNSNKSSKIVNKSTAKPKNLKKDNLAQSRVSKLSKNDCVIQTKRQNFRNSKVFSRNSSSVYNQRIQKVQKQPRISKVQSEFVDQSKQKSIFHKIKHTKEWKQAKRQQKIKKQAKNKGKTQTGQQRQNYMQNQSQEESNYQDEEQLQNMNSSQIQSQNIEQQSEEQCSVHEKKQNKKDKNIENQVKSNKRQVKPSQRKQKANKAQNQQNSQNDEQQSNFQNQQQESQKESQHQKVQLQQRPVWNNHDQKRQKQIIQQEKQTTQKNKMIQDNQSNANSNSKAKNKSKNIKINKSKSKNKNKSEIHFNQNNQIDLEEEQSECHITRSQKQQGQQGQQGQTKQQQQNKHQSQQRIVANQPQKSGKASFLQQDQNTSQPYKSQSHKTNQQQNNQIQNNSYKKKQADLNIKQNVLQLPQNTHRNSGSSQSKTKRQIKVFADKDSEDEPESEQLQQNQSQCGQDVQEAVDQKLSKQNKKQLIKTEQKDKSQTNQQIKQQAQEVKSQTQNKNNAMQNSQTVQEKQKEHKLINQSQTIPNHSHYAQENSELKHQQQNKTQDVNYQNVNNQQLSEQKPEQSQIVSKSTKQNVAEQSNISKQQYTCKNQERQKLNNVYSQSKLKKNHKNVQQNSQMIHYGVQFNGPVNQSMQTSSVYDNLPIVHSNSANPLGQNSQIMHQNKYKTQEPVETSSTFAQQKIRASQISGQNENEKQNIGQIRDNQDQILDKSYIQQQKSNNTAKSPKQKVSSFRAQKTQSRIQSPKNSTFFSNSDFKNTKQSLSNISSRAQIIKQLYGQNVQEQIKKFSNFMKLTNQKQLNIIRAQEATTQTKMKQTSISKLLGKNQILFDQRSIEPQCVQFNSLIPEVIKIIKILTNINQFLIVRLFQNPKMINQTSFGVWLCVNSEWKCIIVDDQIQIDQNNKPVYFYHSNNQIWPIILQKALSKAAGGYKKLIQTPCHKLFTMLTGSNSLFFNVKEDPTKNSKILRYISDCENKNFVIHAQKVCKNLEQLQRKQKQVKVYYLLAQKKVNENQSLIQIREDNKNSFWIKLSKFAQQFRSVEILQLRINHNFCHLNIPKSTSSNHLTIVQLDFFQQAFGSITVTAPTPTALKTYLYKQQKSNILKLVGEAKQKNKINLFFDCCFSDAKYYVFVQTSLACKVAYFGQNKPFMKIVQQVNSQGLKNDYTEYLPIKSINKQNKQKMPKTLNKAKFGDTGMSFKSQQDKISRLRQNFVQYLLKSSKTCNEANKKVQQT